MNYSQYNYTDWQLENETWKEIKDYEGIYEVSDFGRVRTIDGKITNSVRHGERHWKGRILKPKGETYKTGYKVSLWKDKKSKDFLIARLVASTFISEPSFSKNTVNHIDGNRFNNKLENLEWLSLADNIRHAFDVGLHSNCSYTVVIYNNIESKFISLARASNFISRNNGYLSGCLKNNRKATHIDGTVVEFFVTK